MKKNFSKYNCTVHIVHYMNYDINCATYILCKCIITYNEFGQYLEIFILFCIDTKSNEYFANTI